MDTATKIRYIAEMVVNMKAKKAIANHSKSNSRR